MTDSTKVAGMTEEIEAVIACLGDDAAGLRLANPDCEIAQTMDDAAEMLERLAALSASSPSPTGEPVAPLERYEAGLLSDYGGGNVEWWQDYLRSELGRANDFYQDQCANSTIPATEVQTQEQMLDESRNRFLEREAHLASSFPAFPPPSPVAQQAEAILFEHEDGRLPKIALGGSADFTNGEPKWHRVGPVDVSGLQAEVRGVSAVSEAGKLGDGATYHCRKCGEQNAIEFNSARIVTHNRFTGKPRDERDIASDPEGMLIVDPSKPLTAAPGETATTQAPSDAQILEVGMRHFREGHDPKAEPAFIAAVRESLKVFAAPVQSTADGERAPSEDMEPRKFDPPEWVGPSGILGLLTPPQASPTDGGEA